MRSININKLANESKFNRFHGLVLFWCTFIIIFDGYDLVVYGTIVPVLMKEWSLTPVELGTLGSYALFGMAFGAFIFGPLADKIGRKNVALICVMLFSLFTLLCGFANNPTQFGVFRFIAGLGLGGVMPNVVALMTEYAPRQFKSRMVAIMFSGYCVGGVLAAALGIMMIEKMGWHSVFYISALPLVLLPLMYKSLPDSIGFYLAKNQKEKAGYILSKLNPSYTPQKNDQYEIVIPEKTGMTVMQLFKGGRALSTIMFWCAFFMCLLMIYGLNTWLPKLMESAGYALGSSLMFLLVLNLGAIFGAIFGGWAADRWSGKKVLITFFILAAISLGLLGLKSNLFIVYALVAMAGATTIGTQIIAYSYVSQFYPMQIRATGIGWASGVGRFGGVAGPILGGFLLTLNLPFQQNFLAFAIPGIIAALAVGLVNERKTANQKMEIEMDSRQYKASL
ncbi:MFS transporter [Bacillus benzoevorans]|uniref:AAHS family benzoate transporter-like MFS transporter n=1 Tax=Bacillus benzoevorans TaxID=1456 RepID=A0A7X0LYR8_9BACI|nr:aromatic acid/H+ symport family MFS transporter [Bacillus benzoevorans]MBB6447807.1 AAHS family benzoate transporter-like MFS transporter [Bacillus benzoevorans]